jgi:PAS domain S-box-containing protein
MTRDVGSASPMPRFVATTAAFAGLYFLAAALTGSLIGDPGIAVMWPASGVYLGVMLAAPRHMWPALACAAGVGSLAAYLHAGSSLEVSVAFAVPSSAEGLLGALLVERIAGKRFTLGGLHDLIALVVGGAVVANALVALSAGAVAAQTFDASFAGSWLRWWSADALGVIAVAPLITAPLRPGRRRPSGAELREAAWVVAGVGFAICFAAWSEPAGVATLVGGAIALPFLLRAGWRWGPRAAALGGLGVALVATHLASQGSDLVAYAGSVGGQIYIVQAFLAVLLLGSLAFAAAVGDGRRAQTAAAMSRRRLRRAVDSSPDAYLAVDAGGRITDWSAGAEAMFGWDATHALGRSLAETIAPGAGPGGSTPELMLRELTDAPSRELAVVARDRAGRQFPVTLTVPPASERDDDLCHVFIRDISEGERLRDELGRANAELERRRLALEQAGHELGGTAEELEQAGRRVARLTAELAARSVELDEAGRRRERLTEDLRGSQAARGRTEQELGEARSALAAAEQELEALGRELALAVADRDGLRSELDDSARALGRLQAQLGSAAGELERATAGSRALEEEVESAWAAQARTREELAGAISGRRQVEQELELVVRRLEGLRGELQRTQQAHGQTQQALEQARARFAEERERLARSLDETTKSLARAVADRRPLGHNATELISRYDDRGTCLYASPAFRRLLGYEPGELVGRPGAELLHPDDRPRLARARATRSESTFEARLRRRAGDFVWVEVSLHPVRGRGDERLVEINVTVRDISDKRAAEEGRRLAQARFDSIFGTAPTGSALLARDGRVEKANPALCRLTGYSREQLEGTALVAIVHREDAGSCSTGLRRVASGEVATLRFDQQLVHASGRTVPVELSVTRVTTGDSPDMTGDPRLRGLVAHFQDLTERTHARDELGRLAPGHTPPTQTAA